MKNIWNKAITERQEKRPRKQWMKLATAVIEGFGLAKVTKEYLQQVRMLRKREVKRGNVRVVRVSPKRLAELAAEGKQDENPVTK